MFLFLSSNTLTIVPGSMEVSTLELGLDLDLMFRFLVEVIFA